MPQRLRDFDQFRCLPVPDVGAVQAIRVAQVGIPEEVLAAVLPLVVVSGVRIGPDVPLGPRLRSLHGMLASHVHAGEADVVDDADLLLGAQLVVHRNMRRWLEGAKACSACSDATADFSDGDFGIVHVDVVAVLVGVPSAVPGLSVVVVRQSLAFLAGQGV